MAALITGSVVGGTAAAGKLAALTKILGGLNPFTLGGAVKLGSLGLATGAVMDAPGSVQKGILEGGVNPATDEYDVNFLQRMIGGNLVTQDALKSKQAAIDFKALLKDPEVAAASALPGVRAPNKGETKASYLSAVSDPVTQAKNKALSNNLQTNPLYQKMLSDERIQRARLAMESERDYNLRVDEQQGRFDLRRDELGLRRDQMEGNLDLGMFQLQSAQEAQKEKMYYYAQDLAQKRDNDRYRTTAGLIQGLASLGTAFAL